MTEGTYDDVNWRKHYVLLSVYAPQDSDINLKSALERSFLRTKIHLGQVCWLSSSMDVYHNRHQYDVLYRFWIAPSHHSRNCRCANLCSGAYSNPMPDTRGTFTELDKRLDPVAVALVAAKQYFKLNKKLKVAVRSAAQWNTGTICRMFFILYFLLVFFVLWKSTLLKWGTSSNKKCRQRFAKFKRLRQIPNSKLQFVDNSSTLRPHNSVCGCTARACVFSVVSRWYIMLC